MTLRESNATKVEAHPADHAISLEEPVRGTFADILSVAADPALTEDLALALLKRSDLRAEALEHISKNSGVMKSRKVKIALIGHPKTPRHVSLPMVRHLYPFDLMKVALTPIVPADIKVAADDALITRLESVSVGQKLSLARRASGRIAGTLLLDSEPRVVSAALANGRLTEASVIKTLMRQSVPAAFVEAVCRHPKWSLHHEVRVALLRNEKIPFARAVEFASALPTSQLREILHHSRLPVKIKTYLMKELERRSGILQPAIKLKTSRLSPPSPRDYSRHPAVLACDATTLPLLDTSGYASRSARGRGLCTGRALPRRHLSDAG
jgi:hypothetical protein